MRLHATKADVRLIGCVSTLELEMVVTDDVEETGHGRFASLVGAGSRLEGDRLDDLLAFVSMELMRRAAQEGVTDAGLRVLRHVLLAWSRERKATPYAPRQVTVRASGLPIDKQALRAGLASLAEALPITVDPSDNEVINTDLAPWLRDDDIALMDEFERVWLWRHVAAVQDACQHAEATIDLYLGPNAIEALRSDVRGRMERLRDWWADLEIRLTYTRPDHFDEAVNDLWAFHEQVAELERLHDLVVGLLTDPDSIMPPFAQVWKQEGSAKLQALGLPPRSPSTVKPELRLVGGSAH